MKLTLSSYVELPAESGRDYCIGYASAHVCKSVFEAKRLENYFFEK